MGNNTAEIIMINGARKYSGIGHYASNTYEAVKDQAILISLAFSREDHDAGLPGNVFNGFYPPITSGWFINVRFQRFIYSKAFSIVRKVAVNSRIIHYVDPYVLPLNVPLTPVVSILDVIPLSNDTWAPRMWIKYARKCLEAHKKTENIVTCSNKVKKEIENSGFHGRITTIYPYVEDNLKSYFDKKQVRKTLGLPEDKIIVLSVSSKSQRKNLSSIREVMERVGDKFILVRVGGDIGIGKNFVNVDNTTLNKIYRAADLLFFPTLDEGFGYPIAEAMANGLPVVSTDLEVTREVTRNAAVLSEPDVASYTSAIREAVSGLDTLSRKSLNVSRFYEKDRYSSELLNFYNTV